MCVIWSLTAVAVFQGLILLRRDFRKDEYPDLSWDRVVLVFIGRVFSEYLRGSGKKHFVGLLFHESERHGVCVDLLVEDLGFSAGEYLETRVFFISLGGTWLMSVCLGCSGSHGGEQELSGKHVFVHLDIHTYIFPLSVGDLGSFHPFPIHFRHLPGVCQERDQAVRKRTVGEIKPRDNIFWP